MQPTKIILVYSSTLDCPLSLPPYEWWHIRKEYGDRSNSVTIGEFHGDCKESARLAAHAIARYTFDVPLEVVEDANKYWFEVRKKSI